MAFEKHMNGFIFRAPSKQANKKYDVYDQDTGKYITSFGDKNYEQYRDRIGYYKHLDHGDKLRRKMYRTRHEKRTNLRDKTSAGYFAWHYLWPND